MEKLVIATKNQGKLREFKKLLGDRFEVVSADQVGFFDDVEETGVTFEENSYIKAKAVFDFCGMNALADDSGLKVDALSGAPGVYSARYAGEDTTDEKNYRLLLKNLEGEKNRAAHFETAITLITKDKVYKAKGKTFGKIFDGPVGAGGFGYDPVFFSDDLNKSFGEATMEEKNSVSHRYRAIVDLLSQLDG